MAVGAITVRLSLSFCIIWYVIIEIELLQSVQCFASRLISGRSHCNEHALTFLLLLLWLRLQRVHTASVGFVGTCTSEGQGEPEALSSLQREGLLWGQSDFDFTRPPAARVKHHEMSVFVSVCVCACCWVDIMYTYKYKYMHEYEYE